MNIIVTGGAGFIGSNFVFHMLKTHPEDRIICLDKLTYAGNLSTLQPVMDQPNFRFVKPISATARPSINSLKKKSPVWSSILPLNPMSTARLKILRFS